jgi:hypothetical protein
VFSSSSLHRFQDGTDPSDGIRSADTEDGVWTREVLPSLRPRSRSHAYSPDDPTADPDEDDEKPEFLPIPPPALLFGAVEASVPAGAAAWDPASLAFSASQMRDHVHMDLDSSDDEYEAGGDVNASDDAGDASFLDAAGPAPVPAAAFPPPQFASSSSPLAALASANAHSSSSASAAMNRIVDSDLDVLATMPSYDDLKYMILMMRKESRCSLNQLGSGTGAGGNWYVLPGKKWDAPRRAAFASWATRNLGFALRPAGAEVVMLQLSRSAGLGLLARLESSLQSHRSNLGRAAELAPLVSIQPEPFVSVAERDEPVTFMDVCMSSVKPHPPVVASSRSFEYMMEEDPASDLAGRLQSLTVTEADAASENSPFHSGGLPLTSLSRSRSSLGSSAPPSNDDLLPDFLSPRPSSAGASSRTTSSHSSARRQRRISAIGSRLSQGIAATVSAVVNRTSTGFAAIGGATSFDLLETYDALIERYALAPCRCLTDLLFSFGSLQSAGEAGQRSLGLATNRWARLGRIIAVHRVDRCSS